MELRISRIPFAFAPACRGLRKIVGAILFLLVLQADATVYTVTTTANTGAGSLRAAITSANGSAGYDLITCAPIPTAAEALPSTSS